MLLHIDGFEYGYSDSTATNTSPGTVTASNSSYAIQSRGYYPPTAGNVHASNTVLRPEYVNTDSSIVRKRLGVSATIAPAESNLVGLKRDIPQDWEGVLVIGFAIYKYTPSNAPWSLIDIRAFSFDDDPEKSIVFNVDGSVSFFGVKTNLQMEFDCWYYFEVEYHKDGTAKFFCSNSPIATVKTEYVDVKFWHICAVNETNSNVYNSWAMLIDDLYVLDGSGDVNNSRLGKITIYGQYPSALVSSEFNAVGGTNVRNASRDHTRDNVSNYTNVDEASDWFKNTGTVKSTKEIVTVGLKLASRKEEHDPIYAVPLIRESEDGILVDGEVGIGQHQHPIVGVYTITSHIFEKKPSGDVWDLESANKLHYGYKYGSDPYEEFPTVEEDKTVVPEPDPEPEVPEEPDPEPEVPEEPEETQTDEG